MGVRRELRHVVASFFKPCYEKVPGLERHLLMVDVYSGMNSSAQNARPLREALRLLRHGGMLSILPAGRISRLRFAPKPVVADPPWSDMVARLALRTKASIVPVRFIGQNGALFLLGGLLFPSLRVVLLLRETLGKCNKSIRVAIGQPIW